MGAMRSNLQQRQQPAVEPAVTPSPAGVAPSENQQVQIKRELVGTLQDDQGHEMATLLQSMVASNGQPNGQPKDSQNLPVTTVNTQPQRRRPATDHDQQPSGDVAKQPAAKKQKTKATLPNGKDPTGGHLV